MRLAGWRARRPDRVVSTRNRANCLTAYSVQTPVMLDDSEHRVFELPVTGGVKHYLLVMPIVASELPSEESIAGERGRHEWPSDER